MNQEKYLAIEQALQEGRLSEALALLVRATQDQDQDQGIRKDATLLQSKFEYNRNQYEIKGVITDQEFNIHYSKTMLGAQDILNRLQRGSVSSVASGQRFKYRPVMWLTGLLALIFASWFFWPGASEVTAEGGHLADSTTVSLSSTPVPEKGTIAEPILEPKAGTGSSNTAVKPPPVSTEAAKEIKEAAVSVVEEMDKVDDAAPAKTYKVNIIRNSNMSDADIYVDGQPATILSNTLIITIIRVTEKSGMHQFELRRAGESLDCKKELLISQDNQRITFNCN